jgi:ubiquinone/menaquinone biosynthesis C-methylase UbiE
MNTQQLSFSKKIYNFSKYKLLSIFNYVKTKIKARTPINHKEKWSNALQHEIDFWDKTIGTKGYKWKDMYQDALNPDLPLQSYVAALLQNGKKEYNILDVGAGPLTHLGKKLQGVKINITAVDPLAEQYDRILSKYNVNPIVRTTLAEAEKLTSTFKENTFDLVYARNCIDHTYSPEKSILEMIKVAKRNTYVLMEHRANEAEHEHYEGLHQWNFSSKKGDFIISSPNGSLNFTQKYSSICKVECIQARNSDGLITKILKI